MEYWTIKQLADDQHVSYEAIRKQLVRYRKELEGHIIRRKQQKLLDDYAVDFLKKRRRQSPIVVINQERTAVIDDLQAQLEQATREIISLQKQLLDYKQRDEKAIETAVRYEALLADHERTTADLEQARADLMQTQTQLELARIDKEAAEKEAGSYHKSLFGFYRKG